MKIRKISFAVFVIFTLAIFLYFLICFSFFVSDNYTVLEGSSLESALPLGISARRTVAVSDSGVLKNSVVQNTNGPQKVTLSVFGFIPVREVSVNTVEKTLLYPSGECVGIKMYSRGIIVTGFSDFDTPEGVCVSPGAVAGLNKGDIIVSVNGVYTSSVKKFTEIADKAQGECILEVDREGKIFKVKVNPAYDTEGHRRMGIYVKNSVAGVGTMTYVSKDGLQFAALGHGVTDGDTGVMLPLQSATVYKSKVLSIIKGKKGVPGEMAGAIDESMLMGECTCNSQGGIFGVLSEYNPYTKAVYAASRDEVSEGDATVICTVDGSDIPKEYSIRILSVNRISRNKTKSFVIEITDPVLLDKTGGIIQGMSGSPIIQNGKLVGAVTHVFVNDPTRGYGIFIENMLSEADKIK